VLHLEEVAAAWTEVLVGIDKLWCCIGLARYYESLSLWGEAERCYRRSRSISEQQLGADHPDTAASLNNLALLYQSQGRYSDAEPLYAQAVATLLQTLGEAHPNTQTGLNNFVTCLQTALAQGQRQFSDHPLTQFLLQHLSNTET
jgi:tetratricopeptide (TPR) repeat protein